MVFKKIVFEPVDGSANEYVGIILGQLKKNNFHVYSLHQMFSSLKIFRAVGLIHLNWYENVGSEIDFIKKLLNLLLFFLTRKQIVWTMHNKTPHDKGKSIFQRILMYILARGASTIVIHSRLSEEVLITKYTFLRKTKQKIKYVPHPNYSDVYGEMIKSPCLEQQTDKLRLLFVGAVKPYKNIELLISVAEEFSESDLEIRIVGRTYSEAYHERLKESIRKTNSVKLIHKFIPNDEIPQYLAEVDLLILPYDISSSLNSGTAILAFSYGKSVICPKIGTTLDLKAKDKVLLYSYDTPNEHFLVLKQKVKEAIAMKKADPSIFRNWGDCMKAEIDYYNDQDKVGTKLEEIYLQLLR